MEIFEFNCEKCNYQTNTKQCYDRHIMTKKHIQKRNKPFKCKKCEVCFVSSTTLWRHNKECQKTPITEIKELENMSLINCLKKLVTQSFGETAIERIKLITANMVINKTPDDVPELIDDCFKLPTNTTNTNNTTNTTDTNVPIDINNIAHSTVSNNATTNTKSNNTTTTINSNNNINIFLNEKCKESINFHDFIKQIVINIDDLKTIVKKGYTKGITEILKNNLQKQSLYTRPIHLQHKNKVIHIKHKNKWKNKIAEVDKIIHVGIQKLESNIIDGFNAEPTITTEQKDAQFNRIKIFGSSGDNFKDTQIIADITEDTKIPESELENI
jgi:hypothetical protein